MFNGRFSESERRQVTSFPVRWHFSAEAGRAEGISPRFSRSGALSGRTLGVKRQQLSAREHQIGHAAVLKRMEPIQIGAPELWPYVLQVIAEAREQGWIAA